jgi:hypothetical protein
MAKRLNDTAGVIAMSPYETQADHYSRTVRKIDNGYITSHHQYGPNCPDGPTSKEVFTSDHPDLKDASAVGGGGSMMKHAVDYMKR